MIRSNTPELAIAPLAPLFAPDDESDAGGGEAHAAPPEPPRDLPDFPDLPDLPPLPPERNEDDEGEPTDADESGAAAAASGEEQAAVDPPDAGVLDDLPDLPELPPLPTAQDESESSGDESGEDASEEGSAGAAAEDGGDESAESEGEGDDEEEEIDERDTAQLIVKHLPEVVSFCYSRTGDWAMAEEGAQETMVNVVRGESRCPYDDGPEEVRSWILELARAVCVDVLRRRAVASTEAIDPRERLERRAKDRSSVDHGPRRPLDHRASDERSARLVGELTEPGRTIVKLRLWDHRSFEEIGEALGKTAEAVTMLYGEALLELEGALSEEGGGA